MNSPRSTPYNPLHTSAAAGGAASNQFNHSPGYRPVEEDNARLQSVVSALQKCTLGRYGWGKKDEISGETNDDAGQDGGGIELPCSANCQDNDQQEPVQIKGPWAWGSEFVKQGIEPKDFWMLSLEDLKKLGVDKLGDRLRIVNNSGMHKNSYDTCRAHWRGLPCRDAVKRLFLLLSGYIFAVFRNLFNPHNLPHVVIAGFILFEVFHNMEEMEHITAQINKYGREMAYYTGQMENIKSEFDVVGSEIAKSMVAIHNSSTEINEFYMRLDSLYSALNSSETEIQRTMTEVTEAALPPNEIKFFNARNGGYWGQHCPPGYEDADELTNGVIMGLYTVRASVADGMHWGDTPDGVVGPYGSSYNRNDIGVLIPCKKVVPVSAKCTVWMNFGVDGINSLEDLTNNNWEVYASDRGSFVINYENYYTSDKFLQFYQNNDDGYISQALPSGYDYAIVTYGASGAYGYTHLYINEEVRGTVINPGPTGGTDGTAMATTSSGLATTTTTVDYSPGDEIKIKATVSTTRNGYKYGPAALVDSIQVCRH